MAYSHARADVPRRASPRDRAPHGRKIPPRPFVDAVRFWSHNTGGMHEAGIAQRIIEIATEHLEQAGAGAVTSITVKVGRLSSVMPESLDFAFKALAAGTAVANAALTIEQVGGSGRCRSCGALFAVEDFFCVCAQCGSTAVDVQGGDDLTVESLSIES
jgi:hydrogenase nickel incorporation protein HypA/HybF